jgi:hypothetical protein
VFLAIAVDNLADADSLTEEKEKAEEKDRLNEGAGTGSGDSADTTQNNVLIKVTVCTYTYLRKEII